jgi:hypothetical protein
MSKTIEDRIKYIGGMLGYDSNKGRPNQVSKDVQSHSMEITDYLEDDRDFAKDFMNGHRAVAKFASKMSLPYQDLKSKFKYYASLLLTGEPPYTNLERAFSRPKQQLRKAAETLKVIQVDMQRIDRNTDDFYRTLIYRQKECEDAIVLANSANIAYAPALKETNDLLQSKKLRIDERAKLMLYKRELIRKMDENNRDIIIYGIRKQGAGYTLHHMDTLQKLVSAVDIFVGRIYEKATMLDEEIEKLIPMYDSLLRAMKQGIDVDSEWNDLNRKYVAAITMTSGLVDKARKITATDRNLQRSRNSMNALNSRLEADAAGTIDSLVGEVNDARTDFLLDDAEEDPKELG